MSPAPEHNRLQRWYFSWSERHYEGLEPALRSQARALDRYLWSRRGLGVWLGLGGALLGSTAGLNAAGLTLWFALLLSLLLLAGLASALVGAWLMPEKVTAKGSLARWVPRIMAAALVGVLTGWVGGRVVKHGWAAWDNLGEELDKLLRIGLPVGLGVGLVLALLMGLTAVARRYQLQQALEEARAAEERQRMAREASEARLRLLQAQIQPHFIFNTLSAVQHWVDSGDARASSLLRSLTVFLRGSAELMLRPQVSLAEELRLVEHFLQVMQARWGERLRYRLEIDAALAAQAQLPPGIVLSLVENALEHGLAPSLRGGTLQLSLRRAAGTEGSGWCLRIADDGVGLAADWREGLGLGNSRARLEAVFGARAQLQLRQLDQGGTEVLLSCEDLGDRDER